MPENSDFVPLGPEPIPDIVFGGSTISVTELSEYNLKNDVRFKVPLEKVGPEFLFTGSILMSTDGRLYFIPSGQFETLASISGGGEQEASD